MKGRAEILRVHAKGKPLDKSVELEVVARQSPGFSGADLANLVNEAAILAARRNKKAIGMSEFEEALERIVAGPERKCRVISRRREGDHRLSRGRPRPRPAGPAQVDPVAKVSIIGRGMAVGYTMALPTEDRYLQSKTEFEDKIAGTARRQRRRGDDLRRYDDRREQRHREATDLARRMVTEYGMSDKLGPLTLGSVTRWSSSAARWASSATTATRSPGPSTRRSARSSTAPTSGRPEVLTTHRDKLVALAEKLVAEETVDAEGFEALFSDFPPKLDVNGVPLTFAPKPPAAAPDPQPA